MRKTIILLCARWSLNSCIFGLLGSHSCMPSQANHWRLVSRWGQGRCFHKQECPLAEDAARSLMWLDNLISLISPCMFAFQWLHAVSNQLKHRLVARGATCITDILAHICSKNKGYQTHNPESHLRGGYVAHSDSFCWRNLEALVVRCCTFSLPC